MRIPISITYRSIRLNQSSLNKLFGKGYILTKIKNIIESGEYLCKETLTISNQNNKIENINIIGPLQNNIQVEILTSDNTILNTNTPIKASHKYNEGHSICITGPIGQLYVNSCMIIAQNKLYCDVQESKALNIKNGEIIKVKKQGDGCPIFDNIIVRVSDKYKLELKIKANNESLSNIKHGDRGKIVIN